MGNDPSKLSRFIIDTVRGQLCNILRKHGNNGIKALYGLRRASIEPEYAMDRQSANILLRAQLVDSLSDVPSDSGRATVRIPTVVASIAATAIRVNLQTLTVTVRSLDEVCQEIGE